MLYTEKEFAFYAPTNIHEDLQGGGSGCVLSCVTKIGFPSLSLKRDIFIHSAKVSSSPESFSRPARAYHGAIYPVTS
jgi:hypothetical protein